MIQISRTRLTYTLLLFAVISGFCGFRSAWMWQQFKIVELEKIVLEWKTGHKDAEKNTWIYFTRGKEL